MMEEGEPASSAAVPGQGVAAAGIPTTARTVSLAPGFRFHPTDEELVCCYLKRKVTKKPIYFDAIFQINFYKNEPWDLAGKSMFKTRDKECYSFSALDKKHEHGARTNRATGRGCWRATGKDCEIWRDSQVFAMKKIFVFYVRGASSWTQSNWAMYEYRLVDEELGKPVTSQWFRKKNGRTPNRLLCAPFSKKELGDGESASEEDDACFQKKEFEQDTLSTDELSLDSYELSQESQDVLSMFEYQILSDYYPVCMLNREEPVPLRGHKRSWHAELGPNHENASDNYTRIPQDHSSSKARTISMMITSVDAATTTRISELVEILFPEFVEPKESPHVPSPNIDAANPDSPPVPDTLVKFINDLQTEVEKLSVERDGLMLQHFSAQATINFLQSRIAILNEENENLKQSIS